MSYRATLTCDQPGCTTSLTASVGRIDLALRYDGWKAEVTSQGTFHTCPNHKPDALPMAMRNLVSAGRTMLMELRDLDDRGYYVTGHPAEGGGAALHVHSYGHDVGEGPWVQIEQCGRSFIAQLRAVDGTVVLDEDGPEWD